MKLELQEPFRSIWTRGYLRSNDADGRQRVDLINSDQDRTTISYARYLMCVRLGYVLSNEYDVDHINDDKTDDRIENLQILTKAENKLKQDYNYIMNNQIVYGVYCASCGIPFFLTEREVKAKIAQNVELPFCSKSCSTSYHALVSKRIITSTIPYELKQEIKSLREKGLSSYKISNTLEIARNTVIKYWK